MSMFFEYREKLTVTIPSYQNENGITVYVIHVSVGNVSWHICHRFKDFVNLHSILVNEHCISKNLLPCKKIVGNRNPAFIEQRKVNLEIYLQTVINFLRTSLPRALLKFLDFNKYDTVCILENLAAKCYIEGERYLQKSKEFAFNPLQLNAISERYRKGILPADVERYNKYFDFSHVLDFCGKLKTVIIHGSKSFVENSNLMYNNLSFELTPFKSVESLYLYNVQPSNICNVGSLRTTISYLIVYNSNLSKFTDILLCDRVHKTFEHNKENKWKSIKKIDFSWNEIKDIDKGILLAPGVEHLVLDGNQLQNVENTEFLLHLTNLSVAANNISFEECLYDKLKNITCLNLSQNKVTKLSPFQKLSLLQELNLASNLINEINEVKFLSHLLNLNYLVLTGNPISTIIDYRIKIFEYFRERAEYLSLDNERPSQKELDTAAILYALTLAKSKKL